MYNEFTILLHLISTAPLSYVLCCNSKSTISSGEKLCFQEKVNNYYTNSGENRWDLNGAAWQRWKQKPSAHPLQERRFCLSVFQEQIKFSRLK